MIAVDTNIVVSLLLRGEVHAQVERIVARDAAWSVPLLWRSEFRNVLVTYLRQGRIDFEGAVSAAEIAASLVADREHVPQSADVIRTAQETGLSAYDSEYVVVARQLGVPLITLDQAILRAVPDLGLSPSGFLASGDDG